MGARDKNKNTKPLSIENYNYGCRLFFSVKFVWKSIFSFVSSLNKNYIGSNSESLISN